MPLLETEAPDLGDVEWLKGGISLGSGTYILNFWHSGCLGCIERLEQMERLHRQHPGIEAVGIHVPELGLGASSVEKVLEDRDVTHHVAHDHGEEAASSYGPGEGVFLLDDGTIEWQKTPGNSYDDLSRKIQQMTGEEPGLDMDTGESMEDIYLGHGNGDVVNEGLNFAGTRELRAPGNRVPGRAYLDGEWTRQEEHLESGGGTLSVYQDASSMGIVAGADGLKDVEVRLDGSPVPRSLAGEDLRVENGRSYVRVGGKRLYSLLDSCQGSSELELEPEQGARLHRLSFG